MKWYTCDSCTEEFRVVSDSVAFIEYCPFCGSDIEVTDEDEDNEDYD